MPNTVVDEKSLEHLLSKQLRELDARGDRDRDTEFHLAVEQLLQEFGLGARDAADIIMAHERSNVPAANSNRSSAPVKVFRNPYTRETVKTRGFNHHTLNEWRKRHGRLTVQTWRIK